MNQNDGHVGSLSDASTRDCDGQLSPLKMKGSTAKTRFYVKMITKRGRPNDSTHSLLTISSRKCHQTNSYDNIRPPPKRRKGKESLGPIDLKNGIFQQASLVVESGSEPSLPQSSRSQLPQHRPLRKQSVMSSINITGKSNFQIVLCLFDMTKTAS
jgi:hypothetical protein